MNRCYMVKDVKDLIYVPKQIILNKVIFKRGGFRLYVILDI
jgi:hypothetical protein